MMIAARLTAQPAAMARPQPRQELAGEAGDSRDARQITEVSDVKSCVFCEETYLVDLDD